MAGLTFVELLVAMTVSAVLFAGITHVFTTQRRGYVMRQQIAVMQQQSRDAMGFVTRELTMAGYDPTGCACAGIETATAITLRFTQDLNEDGDITDAHEDVTYGLYDHAGDADQDLGRDTGNGWDLVAENIESVSFTYTLDDGTMTATPTNLKRIRAVDIALIARTANRDANYPLNSGYRTHSLAATVQVRNLGP
ncbi:PilW family protein [Candidatus Entotheonella palauensis]|uniref:PilW family protein n=1 Tax=Candidatus Entotheonella palauensis TaxID=93172 RepID=UPI000B7DAEC1|nr:hypothetical protein [Candidatus Entotheonella palauensis]